MEQAKICSFWILSEREHRRHPHDLILFQRFESVGVVAN